MEKFLKETIEISKSAGKTALSMQFNELTVEQKEDDTFVSDVDKFVNNYIFSSLQNLLKDENDIIIIGEESEKSKGYDYSKGKYIFFDPVFYNSLKD
jgi:3'-phosphoadenosine 5'-phosphosulfate (PAPS) 3'-phosphatase